MCNANIFRTLYPHEIDVRVQQVANIGGKVKAVLLLYKNARVDMDLLDEQFGCLGWQREHNFKDGKNYCKVSVYDKDHSIWVSKEDVGTESNTEETKGEASDAFKRACVNLGIGRELYSAPQILVELGNKEYAEDGVTKNGKPKYRANSWLKFRVSAITYNAERSIIGLSIADNNGNIRFTLGVAKQNEPQTTKHPKQKLTTDLLMDERNATIVAEFIHNKWLVRNNHTTTYADVIQYYYECDEDTLNNLIKEIERKYATESTQNA